MNIRPLAWPRIGLILVGITAGVCVFFFGEAQPAALHLLAMVLAIFTSTLLAMIILGRNPQSLYAGSWRVASGHRREIGRVLRRYMLLAMAYLTTILCALLASTNLPQGVSAGFAQVAISLGAAALVWSFGLPWACFSATMAWLNEEVEQRKQDNKQEQLDRIQRTEDE